MLKQLIMLGSGASRGGHSAEMVEIVERINQVRPTWELLGYILPEGGEQQPNGYSILGGPEAIEKYPNAWFAAMNGRPPAALIARDRLASLIDPSSFVSRTAKIGHGVVIYPHCYVGLNARIGDYCFILSGSIVNHDVVLGERVIVTSGVKIAGSVQVGEGCYLGQACTIRQNLTIGEGSLIGMGAVVIRDVPPNSIMAGNPARLLRQR